MKILLHFDYKAVMKSLQDCYIKSNICLYPKRVNKQTIGGHKMAKSAEAIDTVSLSQTSEAITQSLDRHMTHIYQTFKNVNSLEAVKDQQVARNGLFESLDKSVPAVWISPDEHEMAFDLATQINLKKSEQADATGVWFQAGARANGASAIVVTIISKASNSSVVIDPFTAEKIVVTDPTTEEAKPVFEIIGVADIPANCSGEADVYLHSLQACIAGYRLSHPLNPDQFESQTDEKAQERIKNAGF